MRVQISLRDRLIAQFGNRLSEMGRRAPVEMARGLNEGGDKVRTPVRRGVKHQANFKAYSSVTKRTRSKRAHVGALEYSIIGFGSAGPIQEVPYTARGPVIAQSWNTPHRFKRSFKTASGLLRARLGASRFPIRSLRAPSVPKELVKGEAAEIFTSQAPAMVDEMVIKRLGRLLG